MKQFDKLKKDKKEKRQLNSDMAEETSVKEQTHSILHCRV